MVKLQQKIEAPNGLVYVLENPEDAKLLQEAIEKQQPHENLFISGGNVKILYPKNSWGVIETGDTNITVEAIEKEESEET